MDPEPSNTGAGNPTENRKEATTKVPSKDPKKKDDKKDEDLVIFSLRLLIAFLIWCFSENFI